MDLTLDQLLAGIEDSLTKSASECDDKGDKDEKGGKNDKGEKKEFPFTKKDDKDKDKNSTDKDEDKEKSEGQEKEASLAGAALANEIMKKVASLNLNLEMNKQASTAGQALAQALLKKASAGDLTTSNGIPSGVVPNKLQVDNAQMEAEGAATVKPIPTGDGVRATGTVNEIFDAIIADALAQGAASTDQVHEVGVAKDEGAVVEHAVPNQVKTASEIQAEDDLEKAAAISELVAQGINFDDAFEMVKQAEAEIAFEMEKAATLSALMDEGVNFEDAVELVKQASAGDLTTSNGIPSGVVPNKLQVDNAQMEAEGAATVKPIPTGDGVRATGTVNEIFDAIVADALSQGAASTDQVHDTGVDKNEGAVVEHAVPNQVKVAALNSLLEQGFDFDEASELVTKSASAAPLMLAGPKAPGMLSRGAAKLKSLASAAKEDATTMVRGETGKGAIAVNAKGQASVPGRGAAAGRLAKNPLVYGSAAAGAAGAGAGYAMSREKKAAFDALISEGFDFDSAMDLIKEAATPLMLAGPKAPGMLGRGAAKLKSLASAAKEDATKMVRGETGKGAITVNAKGQASVPGRGAAAGRLAKNPLVYGSAAVGAAGAGAAALSREKKAAVDQLTEAGIDFDSAVELVNSKAQELYGE